MALTKCPECKERISDKARSCPHCGVQLRRKRVPQLQPVTEKIGHVVEQPDVQQFRRPWKAIGGMLLLASIGIMGLRDVLVLTGISEGVPEWPSAIGGFLTSAGLILLCVGFFGNKSISTKKLQHSKEIFWGIILFDLVVILASLLIPAIHHARVAARAARANQPQTLTSTDQKFNISVPASWKIDSELKGNEPAITLSVSDRMTDRYMIVTSDAKSDPANLSLSQYAELRLNMLSSGIEQFLPQPVKQIQVGGSQALQCIATGSADGQRITYLITITQGSDQFYQILCWSRHTEFPLAQLEFEAMVSSFQKLP